MIEEKREIDIDMIFTEGKLATGIIYNIIRISDEQKSDHERYIGATGSELEERWSKHKSASGKDRNYPLHIVMFREGVEKFKIVVLATFNNITRSELYQEEAKLIELHDSVRTGWNGKYGSPYCIHGENRRVCPLCEGSAICIHKKRREYCRECRGSAYCEHNRIKVNCIPCDGSQICDHFKRKSECRTCRPCLCCPYDADHGAPENPKHLNTHKHRYNWRIYQIYWTRDDTQSKSIMERDEYVMSLITIADQAKDKLARIDDHRSKVAYTIAELELIIKPYVPLASISLHASDNLGIVQSEPEKVGNKVKKGNFVPTGKTRNCPHGREENCAQCNPCVLCKNLRKNSGFPHPALSDTHKNTQTHINNVNANDKRIAAITAEYNAGVIIRATFGLRDHISETLIKICLEYLIADTHLIDVCMNAARGVQTPSF